MSRWLLGLLCWSIVNPGIASAGLISGTSNYTVQIAANPLTDPDLAGKVLAGGTINITKVFAFNERQSILLTNELTLETGGSIAANTWVSSHYFLFDPAGNRSTNGTLVFDSPILAVFRTRAGLDRTNAQFGFQGANYGNGTGAGLESSDVITFSDRQLNFNVATFAQDRADQFRILTAAPPMHVATEPTSHVAWAGCAMMGLVIWRTRRLVR